MKQYISGFITAVCLSFSFLMFTASQTQNLGDITVNSIRVVDNDNGGFITTYDEEGRITSFIGSVDGGGGKVAAYDKNNVQYSIQNIADKDRKIAEMYGMIHPAELENLTIRSVFIIGPDKKIKLMMTYPASTGRNFNEILRALDSIRLTADHKVATPVDWKNGDDCIIVPNLDDIQAKELFPNGWNALKPYLRLVSDPSKQNNK